MKAIIHSAEYGNTFSVDGYQTANASFALNNPLTLFVPTGSRVVVRRGQTGVTVESKWMDARAAVEMSSTNRNDVLTISEADDVSHTVHVFADERPSLIIHSPKLSLDVGMALQRLEVHTEGDITLDVDAFELELDTLGDITGSFEVAHDLMLHTITYVMLFGLIVMLTKFRGDIAAEITVVHHEFPKHHGKHHKNKHHKDKKHKDKKHEHKDKKHERKDKKYEHKHSEKSHKGPDS